jgi:hypothetical protein
MTGPFVGTTKRCDAFQVWPRCPVLETCCAPLATASAWAGASSAGCPPSRFWRALGLHLDLITMPLRNRRAWVADAHRPPPSAKPHPRHGARRRPVEGGRATGTAARLRAALASTWCSTLAGAVAGWMVENIWWVQMVGRTGWVSGQAVWVLEWGHRLFRHNGRPVQSGRWTVACGASPSLDRSVCSTSVSAGNGAAVARGGVVCFQVIIFFDHHRAIGCGVARPVG